jgi:hypothetical protein
MLILIKELILFVKVVNWANLASYHLIHLVLLVLILLKEFIVTFGDRPLFYLLANFDSMHALLMIILIICG